jgi:hypothetical protein
VNVSKNKVFLKETNISGYSRYPPPPPNCDDATESYSTAVPKMFPTAAGSIIGISAYLIKGSTWKVTPLSKL